MMRDLIDLVEGLLAEGIKHEVYAATGDPFPIFEDPSKGQLAAARRAHPSSRTVKGILTDDGRLFIWPAYYAHHGDVWTFFKSPGIRLEMGAKGPAISGRNPASELERRSEFYTALYDQQMATLRASPALNRLYGADFPIEVMKTAMPAMMGVFGNEPTTPDEIKSANTYRKRLDLPTIRAPRN